MEDSSAPSVWVCWQPITEQNPDSIFVFLCDRSRRDGNAHRTSRVTNKHWGEEEGLFTFNSLTSSLFTTFSATTAMDVRRKATLSLRWSQIATKSTFSDRKTATSLKGNQLLDCSLWMAAMFLSCALKNNLTIKTWRFTIPQVIVQQNTNAPFDFPSHQRLFKLLMEYQYNTDIMEYLMH